MSRKHKRRQRSFPWPILMFGGVLLLVAAFLVGSRAGAGDGSSGGAGAGGTPKIAVDPPKIDYGYVKFGNNETFKIKVTNAGNGVLRFAEQPYIEVLEGC